MNNQTPIQQDIDGLLSDKEVNGQVFALLTNYIESTSQVERVALRIGNIINTQKRLYAEIRETELLDALYWMYYQYCDTKSGHMFMGAGETASEILEDAGYITVNSIGAIIKDNGDSAEQRARIK